MSVEFATVNKIKHCLYHDVKQSLKMMFIAVQIKTYCEQFIFENGQFQTRCESFKLNKHKFGNSLLHHQGRLIFPKMLSAIKLIDIVFISPVPVHPAKIGSTNPTVLN